jgi:hypothetical protein
VVHLVVKHEHRHGLDPEVAYPVRDPHGDEAAALLAGNRTPWLASRPT